MKIRAWLVARRYRRSPRFSRENDAKFRHGRRITFATSRSEPSYSLYHGYEARIELEFAEKKPDIRTAHLSSTTRGVIQAAETRVALKTTRVPRVLSSFSHTSSFPSSIQSRFMLAVAIRSRRRRGSSSPPCSVTRCMHRLRDTTGIVRIGIAIVPYHPPSLQTLFQPAYS